MKKNTSCYNLCLNDQATLLVQACLKVCIKTQLNFQKRKIFKKIIFSKSVNFSKNIIFSKNVKLKKNNIYIKKIREASIQ